jgi:hypothetical protein
VGRAHAHEAIALEALEDPADEGAPPGLAHLTVEADPGPELLRALRDERLARVHVNGADAAGPRPAAHEELQDDLRVVAGQLDEVLRERIGEGEERGSPLGLVSLELAHGRDLPFAGGTFG